MLDAQLCLAFTFCASFIHFLAVWGLKPGPARGRHPASAPFMLEVADKFESLIGLKIKWNVMLLCGAGNLGPHACQANPCFMQVITPNLLFCTVLRIPCNDCAPTYVVTYLAFVVLGTEQSPCMSGKYSATQLPPNPILSFVIIQNSFISTCISDLISRFLRLFSSLTASQ